MLVGFLHPNARQGLQKVTSRKNAHLQPKVAAVGCISYILLDMLAPFSPLCSIDCNRETERS